MKTLGLIGGTSYHSTMVYYRLLNELVGEKIGTQGNPPLILYSLNIELMREGNKEKINNAYLKVAKILQAAGAEAVMICANTPHMVYPFVAQQLDIPILHIADATGQRAKASGIKQLGLLGNRPTMIGGFIQSRLKEKFDIATIIPSDEHLDKTHFYVSKELTQGKFTAEAKAFFLHQMELLKDRGVEGIILGCTELPMLIEQPDFGPAIDGYNETACGDGSGFYFGEVVINAHGMEVTIRQEKNSDHPAVFKVVEAAFRNEATSDQTEQLLVERLRNSEAFIPELSLVAENGNKIVGHILLTKAKIRSDLQNFNSLALAPVSVLPEYQKKGIGGQLITVAHEKAHSLGYSSVVVLGHKDYYPKFGYQQADKFGIEFPFDAPKVNCMVVELEENGLDGVCGVVEYASVFFE